VSVFFPEEVCFSVDWDNNNCSILTVSDMLWIMKLGVCVRVASILCLNPSIVCIYIIGINKSKVSEVQNRITVKKMVFWLV
jgi:hypothetical protein